MLSQVALASATLTFQESNSICAARLVVLGDEGVPVGLHVLVAQDERDPPLVLDVGQRGLDLRLLFAEGYQVHVLRPTFPALGQETVPEFVPGLELAPLRRVGSRARCTAAALPDGRERRRALDTLGHRQRRIRALGGNVPEVVIRLEPATGLSERYDAAVVVLDDGPWPPPYIRGGLFQHLLEGLPLQPISLDVLEELRHVEVAVVSLGEVDALDPEPMRGLPFFADPPLEQIQCPVGVLGERRNGGSPVDVQAAPRRRARDRRVR